MCRRSRLKLLTRDFPMNLWSVHGNNLLASLPQTDFAFLRVHLHVAALPRGKILLEVGDVAGHVYFPLSGAVSFVVIMRNGKAVETGVVGREGVIGAMAALNLNTSSVRAIVRHPGTVCQISAARFRELTCVSQALADISVGYNEVLLTQARLTAACNALHSLEARFCCRLLRTSDCLQSDTINLTHEVLSEMLGVRRTSITDVALKLHAAGVISYSRGVIKINDLVALRAESCECYETLRAQTSP